jgi:hypothetical protein
MDIVESDNEISYIALGNLGVSDDDQTPPAEPADPEAARMVISSDDDIYVDDDEPDGIPATVYVSDDEDIIPQSVHIPGSTDSDSDGVDGQDQPRFMRDPNTGQFTPASFVSFREEWLE